MYLKVVNAFCKEKDAEMKGKVLVRLQNITELQRLLEKCLVGKHTQIYIEIWGGNCI